jgi:hypothetical protein
VVSHRGTAVPKHLRPEIAVCVLLFLLLQVRYLGFQFASIKAFNMIAAVATVATQDVCRKRSTAACTLK